MLQKRAILGVLVVAAVLVAGPIFGEASEPLPTPALGEGTAVSGGNAEQVSSSGLVQASVDKMAATPPVTMAKAAAAIQTGAQSCSQALSRARMMCLESLSPHIQNAVAILSAVGTVISSVKDQCSQSAKNLEKAQMAMTLYNGACAATKAICEQTCFRAEKTTTALASKGCGTEAAATYKTPDTIMNATATCQAAAESAQAVFTEVHKVCTDYRMNLAAGAAALAKIVMDKGKAEQCQDESGTVDCAKNPTDVSCNQMLDCSLAANSANQVCICEKSPRTPGCGGSTNVSSTNDYMKSTGAPAPSNALGGAPSSLGSGLNDSPYYGGGGSNGSGGGLAGGGGGAGGGGSGAAKGTDGSNKGENAALNANVLEGSGGGGGFRGGLGGGYGANDPYGKYKAYIPKDGNGRGLAGTTAADQVTGSNGLSNWEKVKVQYSNMKPTLLGR